MSSYTIQSVDRALSVLECFTFEQPELTFTDICTKTGLSKATVKRLAETLLAQGYLSKPKTVNTYRLGIKLFKLGQVVKQYLNLETEVREWLRELWEKTGETIILVALKDHAQIYLHKIEGSGAIRVGSAAGMFRPLYYGLGRTMLAFLPEEKQNYYLPPGDLPRYTDKTICSRADFLAELATIREKGYAIDNEEYIEGLVGIGVPVFDHHNEVQAFLGILLPNIRATEERIGQFLGEMKATSGRLNTLNLNLSDM